MAMSSSSQVSSSSAASAGTFTDKRDGKTYRIVQIGTQTWMAENLAYLPSVNSVAEWSATEARYYVYDYSGNDVAGAKATTNYAERGVLYNWPAAMDGELASTFVPSGVKGVCPEDWHLPSKAEWQALANFVDLDDDGADNGSEGASLKAAALWMNDGIGNDKYGFAAIPGGVCIGSASPHCANIDEYGKWWATSNANVYNIDIMILDYGRSYSIYYEASPFEGLSVRCVMD